MIEELVLRQHHVAVFVGDMERSIRFYQRCFGFRLCLTMLKLKDIVLELLSVDEWPTERLRTACLNTNTHFSIMVSDVAEARRRLEQDPELTFEEADIRRVPNVGPMDLLVAFLRGPDGERIELLQDRNNAVL